MSTPVLPPYNAPFLPVPQITPFTYRDGITMLKKLDYIVKYINKELVPFVNENYSELAEEFQNQVNILIAQVNAALASQTAEVDQKIEDLTEYVDEAVETILNGSVETSDALNKLIFENASSLTRGVTDSLYASKSLEDNVEALELLVSTGRLSDETLDQRFNEKANVTDLETTNDNVSALSTRVDNNDTDIENLQDTVDSGRLSEATIDGRFEDVDDSIIVNRLGGFKGDSRFNSLRTAIFTPATSDMRVCVLGSSSINGAYTTEPEKQAAYRLAMQCNASTYPDLDLVVAPVTGVGMRWWNGGEGNTTSANYFPTARRTALNYVKPNFVIHMVGENDYFYGTTIADYITNMEAACDYIEENVPGSINILIHSHGRRDVTSPVASWDAYGNALKSVADNNPSRRYFINMMDYFYPLGTMTDNIAGMLYDQVHPNDAGHKYLAKIIGAHLGIPDPDDYATEQSWLYPFETTPTDYTTQGAVIGPGGLVLESANYPREIEFSGSMWITNTSASGYVNAVITNASNGSVVKSVSHSMGAVGAKSMVFSDRMYIPPRMRVGILLQAFPSGSVTVQPQTSTPNALTRVRITSIPL